MFQWMIEAFPCFLNIELRFRIILVPLDDLIPVFGIEQDTGMALRELRQHFLQGGRIERTCLLVHIEMIDGRPFFFAVLIKAGVLPIPFPFFKEFERIEESPVSFGGHYFRFKLRITCDTDAVCHFRFVIFFFHSVKHRSEVGELIRPHETRRIDCYVLTV